MSLEKVMRDIVKLCEKISREEMEQLTLVISLQKIMDYTDNPPIPKITYKEQNDAE